jgi:hypothetical protein
MSTVLFVRFSEGVASALDIRVTCRSHPGPRRPRPRPLPCPIRVLLSCEPFSAALLVFYLYSTHHSSHRRSTYSIHHYIRMITYHVYRPPLRLRAGWVLIPSFSSYLLFFFQAMSVSAHAFPSITAPARPPNIRYGHWHMNRVAESILFWDHGRARILKLEMANVVLHF